MNNKRNNSDSRKRMSQQASQGKRLLTIVAWVGALVAALYLGGKQLVGGDEASAVTDNVMQSADGGDLCRVVVPDSVDNVVVDYMAYRSYFNPKYHEPNCVVYELTRSEARGRMERNGMFQRDLNVKGCANYWDYKKSGYDRGHMAPAGDMRWDSVAMVQSFMMTNVCPQIHEFNERAWNDLEQKVREWAVRDSAIIVASGPIFSPDMPTIGKDVKVAVPSRFYKVILAPYSNPVRAIGFIMPNEDCRGRLSSYAVTVDKVESLTGLDFFSALPDDVENKVEQEVRTALWRI